MILRAVILAALLLIPSAARATGPACCGGGGGSGGAPTGATYVVQTPDATLSAEQALSALTSGLLLNTTGTGVLSIYGGSTCGAGAAPRGLDASGAVQNCTSYLTAETGDVSDVGDCTTGACFTAAGTGTSLVMKNATSGSVTLNTVAGALGSNTISFPAQTGTVCTTGSVCSGYQASGSYAPANATYITQTADATLSAEQAMGALGTGLVKNTTTTGVQSIYAGTSCTNQFPRSLDASGAATCASVASADITDGTIAFADVNSTQTLAGNPANGASSVWIGTTGLIWEGSTSDSIETLLVAADPTASDKTVTIPNETGTVCTTGSICAGTVQYQAGLSGGDVTTTSGGASATIATGAVTTGKILDATIAQVDIDDTQTLAGNPANGDSSVWFATTGLIWEGATSNSNEGLLVAADVGGDRTWTLPDASGTIAVSASTPLTLNATTGNLTIADAAADSSTKGAVTFPSTHFTCTSGTCSLLASPTFGAASGTSYTWTWDLSSGTDPSLIFSTGAVALGSSTGLYGSTSSSGDLNLFSTTHATKGQITLDDQVDIWPSIPDATAASRAIDFSSDYAVSGVAVIHSLMNSRPTVHVGAASGLLGGFAVVSSSGMVIAHDNATATPSGVLLFYADHTIRTTVAAAAPESVSFYDHTTVQGSGSITVPSSSGHRSFYANPIISAVDSATATYSAVTMYDALPRVGTDNGASTDGTAVTVTTLKGFNYADVLIDGGTGTETVATQVGVDIGALANGGTNIGLRNASTSVFTPTTQAIAAATDTITCNTTFKKFTTFTGTNALTSNPSIADGQTGQICILENVDATGTDCITLTDSTKGMQLSGNFTLCPNDTIILIYDGTDWIELSEMDN